MIHLAVPLLLAIYVFALAHSFFALLRQGQSKNLVPAAALLFTQFLWFTLPALLSFLAPGRYPGQQAALAFVFIAVGHCVQYLWISAYVDRALQGNDGDAGKSGAQVPFLLRATLLGAALWVVPALLFSPGAFGHLPFEAGLGLLIAAAVNLHHFALDGMIWRLREPRIGRLLTGELKREPPTLKRMQRGQNASPLFTTCALLMVGGLSAFTWLAATWEREVGYRRAYAEKDLARLQRASQNLATLGRDGPQIHVALAKLKAQKGQTQEAILEYRRSLELFPTAAAWMGLGRIYQSRGDFTAAESAYLAAQELKTDRDD